MANVVVAGGSNGVLAASAHLTDVTGVFTPTAGISTAASTPVLTPTFGNGTAAQLADKTRDYVVYLECTTSGTATTIAIGPTSTPANTIMASAAATAGTVYTVRLPAGWWLQWAGTTTAFATQTAIGC